MFRTIIAATCLLGSAMTAVAAPDDDAPIDPRVAELLEDLPTREEMQSITQSLPDMTVMMFDLKDFAESERTQTRLDRITGRIESLTQSLEQIEKQNGVPDMNAALDELMVIPTDRALMGDLFSLMFELTDVMKNNLPEDAQLDLERSLQGEPFRDSDL